MIWSSPFGEVERSDERNSLVLRVRMCSTCTRVVSDRRFDCDRIETRGPLEAAVKRVTLQSQLLLAQPALADSENLLARRPKPSDG